MEIRSNTLSNLVAAVLVAGLLTAGQAGAQGTLFVVDDKVGIGTDTPDQEIDVESSGPNFRLTNTGPGGGFFDFRMNADSGRFTFTDDPASTRNPFKIGVGANNNLLRIGIPNANEITIAGDLILNGTSVTPDYVFLPEYELESIEDHAAKMWKHKYLPSVGGGQVDQNGMGSINLARRSQGMLEELEKAHIYIDQLNSSLKEKDGRIVDLEVRLSRIETALQSQK